MKLHNTLTRSIEPFTPIEDKKVGIYSCGPTIYDHIHIGNLSAFIYADFLRRTLQASDYDVLHVMNFTDIDDKTIRRSHEKYPNAPSLEALRLLTEEYKKIFLSDMQAIGNDVSAVHFVSAVKSIPMMQTLIDRLYKAGYAYVTDDGVYFSIEAYKKDGKKYGQLLELNANNTSGARIDNDEYDKESVHDFALWKAQKGDEPAWGFELEGKNLTGRPGWHIECSAMSVAALGQPFDIHTGGVDLIFPHHENEIAQSTAGQKSNTYAKYFVHNEHLLVDSKKMSKSLNNFYTLKDIQKRGIDPLAFRLMVLQSHYRSQSNFTWENLSSAQNRLKSYRSMAVHLWQTNDSSKVDVPQLQKYRSIITQHAQDDLSSPAILATLSELDSLIHDSGIAKSSLQEFRKLLEWLDELLGLDLSDQPDLTDEQKKILYDREEARKSSDWSKSDMLRDELSSQGIGLRDTDSGQIWFRI